MAAESKMLIYQPNGTVFKHNRVATEGSPIQDMTYHNGFAYFATKNELIKADLSGIIVWNSLTYLDLNIDRVEGVFIENDLSISVFCTYINTLNEMDIALLRINENGKLILK